MTDEPLNNHDARKLIRQIVEHGTVLFSGHCRTRMNERGVSHERILHALANGFVENADLEGASWRYRVKARKLFVVVAFVTEEQAVVVTTWETDR